MLRLYIWIWILVVEAVWGYGSLNSTSRVEVADRTFENFTIPPHLRCNESMDYTMQHCYVENSPHRDCLVQKSLLLNNTQCQLARKNNIHYGHECWYYEVCVFSTPKDIKWLCGYECDVEKYEFVKCHKSGDDSFSTPCHRAFVHCPTDKPCIGQFQGGAKYLLALFQDDGECTSKMNEVLSQDVPWYWINQAHFDGASYGMGDLRLIRPSNNTLQEICTSKTSPWVYSIPVIGVFILAVLLLYCIQKYRKFYRIPDPKNNPDDPIYIILRGIFSDDSTAYEQNIYQDNVLEESSDRIDNYLPTIRESVDNDNIDESVQKSTQHVNVKNGKDEKETNHASSVLSSLQSDTSQEFADSSVIKPLLRTSENESRKHDDYAKKELPSHY